MDHAQVVRRRKMVRAFTPEPVLRADLDTVLAAGLRGPSAGNTQGIDLVVLDGPHETRRYWDVTMDPERRDSFAWPGLLVAPVLVLVVCDPDAYVQRYAAPDKVRTGLGAGADAWPVPYWFVDAGAATMAMLYAAVDASLGALLFGPFEHEDALRNALGVPAGRRLAATVALGHPAPDRPSASARRQRRDDAERIHRGGWLSG